MKGFLMVLAPLDLNMSAKELQSLNSSRYCNTSFFVFLVKTSWKHCQSGLMARFQFDLGTSTWFAGTWGPLSRNACIPQTETQKNGPKYVGSILHQVGKFLCHINTCKIRELLLEVLNHLCSRLREQIAKVTRVKSFSSNLIRTDTYKRWAELSALEVVAWSWQFGTLHGSNWKKHSLKHWSDPIP